MGGSIPGSNYKWFRTKFANFNRQDFERLNFEFLAQNKIDIRSNIEANATAKSAIDCSVSTNNIVTINSYLIIRYGVIEFSFIN